MYVCVYVCMGVWACVHTCVSMSRGLIYVSILSMSCVVIDGLLRHPGGEARDFKQRQEPHERRRDCPGHV